MHVNHVQMGMLGRDNNESKTIHPNDEVYILGDVTMVRPGRATEIIAQLKGRKYLIMGNHDYFAREKRKNDAV